MSISTDRVDIVDAWRALADCALDLGPETLVITLGAARAVG